MARGGAGQYNVSRLFADYDEDLLAVGKKDDDLRPPNGAGAASWAANLFRVRNRRRFFMLTCVLFVGWMFVRGLPADFWEPNETGARRIAEFQAGPGTAGAKQQQQQNGYVGPGRNARPASGWSRTAKEADEAGAPPRLKDRRVKENNYYYDGEIQYLELPATVNDIPRTLGNRPGNQNVLFAASSLKSLSTFIPMACEMAAREFNFVHVAVFGRSEFSMDEILRINGVDRNDCKAFWHDARPNWAGYSSDFRAEASVAGGLDHLQSYIRPQAVIMDDSGLEDQWFTRQLRIKAKKFDWPVIELPAGSSESLQWLSRLDTVALRAFHKTSVEIIVQAPKDETGGLIRLLKSLKDADYHGLPVPSLTIELPADVDPMLGWYIAGYKWPPPSSPMQPLLNSQLHVRHRIPGQTLSPEEASVRFLETFYPANAEQSHVLVLSTNVELAPQFYHWLMYHILHYKYSRAGSAFSQNFVGLSLDIPTKYPDSNKKFDPPVPDPFGPTSLWPGNTSPRHPDTRPPFLWQAPDANAALYFGNKWAEIHDFLRHRLRQVKEGTTKRYKVIGKQAPEWTDYFLEIMRARGWSMVYPATSQRAHRMATVHTELWNPPEEFAEEYRKAKEEKAKDDLPLPPDVTFPLKADPADWQQSEPALTPSGQLLHAILPFLASEPPLRTLPNLLVDGATTEQAGLAVLADTFAEKFRRTTGGCAATKYKGKRKVVPGKAADLFCWGDEPASAWEPVEPAAPAVGEAAAK